MDKNTRQHKIIDLLQKKNFLRVSELAKHFDTTVTTIRRDMDTLEKNQLIQRTHGGAVLLKTESLMPTFSERIDAYTNEKGAIAKAASEYIRPNNIVCFDGSTSALALLQFIPKDLHFTAITTGVITAAQLCSFPNVEIIQVGGMIHHSSYTCISILSLEFIKQFNADIAFISTRAVRPLGGTYELNMDMVGEKRALISISKKVVLLADHTKFGNRSLCKTVSINEIDTVITDDKTSKSDIEKLKEQGGETIVVKVDAAHNNVN